MYVCVLNARGETLLHRNMPAGPVILEGWDASNGVCLSETDEGDQGPASSARVLHASAVGAPHPHPEHQFAVQSPGLPVAASCLSSNSGRLLLNQAGCQGEQAAEPPTSPAVRYRIYSTARMGRDRLYVFGQVAWGGSNRRLRPVADRILRPDL